MVAVGWLVTATVTTHYFAASGATKSGDLNYGHHRGPLPGQQHGTSDCYGQTTRAIEHWGGAVALLELARLVPGCFRPLLLRLRGLTAP